MEETKFDKIKVMLMYLMAALIPFFLIYGYVLFINRQVDYKDMIDYKINSDIKVSNIAKGEELEIPVYLTNENPKINMLVRFKFDVDGSLLNDDNVGDILKLYAKDKQLVKFDEYYYVAYNKAEKILLFDKILWLKDKVTKDNMQFDLKVEAIKASRSVLKKQWLDSGDLELSAARRLNYLK